MTVYKPCCAPEKCLIASGVVDLEYASSATCPVVAKANSILRDVFGYTEFRPGQLLAVIAAMHGHDTFVRMRTGGGKTICMFLPVLSMSLTSLGVVISPLNSIMDEQVLKW